MQTLLIIDEDLSVFNFVREKMNPSEFTVLSSTSARDALVLLSKQKVDCILMDIVLADISGMRFLEKLREGSNFTPVMFITSIGNDRIRDRVLKLGCLAYFTRPLDMSLMLREIIHIMGKLPS